jgi:hypothetical protein
MNVISTAFPRYWSMFTSVPWAFRSRNGGVGSGSTSSGPS